MKRDFLILITQSEQLVKLPKHPKPGPIVPLSRFLQVSSLLDQPSRWVWEMWRRLCKKGWKTRKRWLQRHKRGRGGERRSRLQPSWWWRGLPPPVLLRMPRLAKSEMQGESNCFCPAEPQSKALINFSKIISLLRPQEVFSGQHALLPSVQGGSGFWTTPSEQNFELPKVSKILNYPKWAKFWSTLSAQNFEVP